MIAPFDLMSNTFTHHLSQDSAGHVRIFEHVWLWSRRVVWLSSRSLVIAYHSAQINGRMNENDPGKLVFQNTSQSFHNKQLR